MIFQANESGETLYSMYLQLSFLVSGYLSRSVFFLFELYRWWSRMRNSKASAQRSNTLVIGKLSTRYLTGYLLLCGAVFTFAALLGLKILLALLIVLGLFLFVM